MQATFVVDLKNMSEVKDLRDVLNLILDRDVETDDGDEDSSGVNNIEVLNKFLAEASDNQLKVLKWMKDHPGNVSAHVLKKELPFLAPTGTISGVFRPGRWQRLAGGTKEGFPFLQITWDHDRGCGIYRGLTEEEAAALDI